MTTEAGGVPVAPSGDAPWVTVIALCYNHERFLRECLDSIAKQTFQDFELIITDDASRDGSVALIEQWIAEHRPGTIFIRNAQNRGICATLNLAIRRASGRFISMVATDDAWLPHKVEAQLAAAREVDSQTAVVYSDAAVMDENGAPIDETFLARHGHREASPPSGNIFPALAEGNFIPALSTLIRRDALIAVGGYDERLSYEDYDMWLRLAGAGYGFHFLPGTPARYRLVRSSMTNTVFIRPNPAFNRSVILLHDRWMRTPLLSPSQRRKFASKMGSAAYNLYAQDAADAARWLRMVAWRTGELRLWVLAVVRTLGVPRGWLQRLSGLRPGA